MKVSRDEVIQFTMNAIFLKNIQEYENRKKQNINKIRKKLFNLDDN